MLLRIWKVFLAGIILSFAWPIRGQFGHEWGAMIPGALAALTVSLLVIEPGWRQSFAQAVIFSILGFAIGGAFGYGSLVDEIVAAPSLKDVIPQLIHVFLIGAIWGGLGMSFLGFGIAEVAILFQDLAVLTFAGVGAWLGAEISHLGQNIYWYSGGLALLQGYNTAIKKSGMVFLFGIYGFLGFGLGFLISVIILWYGSHGYLPGSWWSLRDQIWGFLGGVAVILAACKAVKKNYTPALITSLNLQRVGFIVFVSGVTAINTWNVYQKWFQSNPPVSNPTLAGIFLALCVTLLIVLAIYFMKAAPGIFSEPGLDSTLLWTSLFFCAYLGILAILKSIVYSGMAAWETAFTLFLIDLAIFGITFPRLLRPKSN